MAIGSCTTSCSSSNPYANYIREQQQSLDQKLTRPKTIEQQYAEERTRVQAPEFRPDPSRALDVQA